MSKWSDERVPDFEASAMGRRGMSFIGLWILLTAANVLPIWMVKYFPAQNGPWFLATAQIFKEIDNPQLGYAEFYERSWFPIPHLSFDGGVLLLSYVMPLMTAEKVMYSVFAVLMPLSVLYFLSVIAPERKLLALLGFLMIYSYPLLRGYNDFVMSIPVFFFAFGYWLKWKDAAGPLQYLVLAVLSILLYLSHLIAFLLLGCTIGWYQLREGKGWWGATKSAAAATWIGWPLVIAYVVFNRTSSQWITHSDTKWNPFHWTVQYFVERFFMSVSEPAYYLAVAMWAWPLLLLAASARRDPEGWWSWCRRTALSPLGSLVLVLLATYLILPDHIIGWHKFNQRLIPFTLIALLGVTATVVNAGAYRRLRGLFASTVACAALLVPVFMTSELWAMDAVLRQYTAALDKMPPRARFLAVHGDSPRFGFIYPLTRAHEYYLIEKGGANGGTIASMNTLAMVWYRHYPVSDTFPPYRDEMNDAEFQEMLSAYDAVLIWGGDRKIDERLKGSTFRTLHDDGPLRLYARS